MKVATSPDRRLSRLKECKDKNLEWDLLSNEWIVSKARANKSYAQNIYAALCNNEFQRLDVAPDFTDQRWSCSWRYAGGIVADMVGQGDYMDWYCSGMDVELENVDYLAGYVAESFITDEIKEDFKRLGWIVIEDINP
jgi:hypothetical protein